MKRKMRANLIVWIRADPRHRDFTGSKRDSKFPGMNRAKKPKRETSELKGLPVSWWQIDIARERNEL